MSRSYQFILGIVLLLACFNLEASSFARNLHSNIRRPNATHIKPAISYQPWAVSGYNNTRPQNGRFNLTQHSQPLQSSPQYGALYPGAVQQPNIGFHNNFVVSGTPIQSNGTYGFNSQAQLFYPNGTTHGNFNYTKPSNGTFPYARLFKLW